MKKEWRNSVRLSDVQKRLVEVTIALLIANKSNMLQTFFFFEKVENLFES